MSNMQKFSRSHVTQLSIRMWIMFLPAPETVHQTFMFMCWELETVFFFFSECSSNGYVYSFIEVYSSLTNVFLCSCSM